MWQEMYASVVDKDWYSTLIDAWLDGMSEALARESEADRKKAEVQSNPPATRYPSAHQFFSLVSACLK